MKKGRICFFEVEKWEEEILRSRFSNQECKLFSEHLQDVDLATLQDCEVLSSFVFSILDEKTLHKLPSLKMIATRSTGFDHIDLNTCKKRGIHVANVPLYGERTVAEHTFALILALYKKIIPSVERTRGGSFSLENLRGCDLNGKTLGIIGTGNIGKHVARIAWGFEMNILAHDIAPDSSLEKAWGLKYVSLEELLENSDIITLHVPANSSTQHLIHEKHLPLIKKGALLINTARGSVVDTKALVKGITNGIFGGLGLDVLEHEPKIREERELLSTLFKGENSELSTLLANEFLLHHRENVIITPHNAFNTHEALERILLSSLQNIQDFEKGLKTNSVF